MAGFPDVLSSAQPLEGGFRVQVPPEWHQGRTAYGGFSSALALSAAMELDEALPPLRSAQVSMIAPVAGEVEVRAQPVRKGKNATWISARITGKSGTALIAGFVFMGPVESALHVDECTPPEGLIAPGDAMILSRDRGASFLRNHFDVRFALPRPEKKTAEICWWVKLRDRAGLDPMVELMLIADALPAGVMPLLPPTVPVSTMQWQANILAQAPAARDGWWLLRTVADYADHGCSSQHMAVWNTDGLPMMAGVQSVAVFG